MTTAGIKTRFRFLVSLRVRAGLLPLLARGRQFEGLLALAVHARSTRFAGLDADYICRHVMLATRWPLLMRDRRCLREGLLGHYYLQAAGFKPELRFAVERGSHSRKKVKAHCWVNLDGRPVLNDQAKGYVEVFTFPTSNCPAKSAVLA